MEASTSTPKKGTPDYYRQILNSTKASGSDSGLSDDTPFLRSIQRRKLGLPPAHNRPFTCPLCVVRGVEPPGHVRWYHVQPGLAHLLCSFPNCMYTLESFTKEERVKRLDEYWATDAVWPPPSPAFPDPSEPNSPTSLQTPVMAPRAPASEPQELEVTEPPTPHMASPGRPEFLPADESFDDGEGTLSPRGTPSLSSPRLAAPVAPVQSPRKSSHRSPVRAPHSPRTPRPSTDDRSPLSPRAPRPSTEDKPQSPGPPPDKTPEEPKEKTTPANAIVDLFRKASPQKTPSKPLEQSMSKPKPPEIQQKPAKPSAFQRVTIGPSGHLHLSLPLSPKKGPLSPLKPAKTSPKAHSSSGSPRDDSEMRKSQSTAFLEAIMAIDEPSSSPQEAQEAATKASPVTAEETQSEVPLLIPEPRMSGGRELSASNSIDSPVLEAVAQASSPPRVQVSDSPPAPSLPSPLLANVSISKGPEKPVLKRKKPGRHVVNAPALTEVKRRELAELMDRVKADASKSRKPASRRSRELSQSEAGPPKQKYSPGGLGSPALFMRQHPVLPSGNAPRPKYGGLVTISTAPRISPATSSGSSNASPAPPQPKVDVKSLVLRQMLAKQRQKRGPQPSLSTASSHDQYMGETETPILSDVGPAVETGYECAQQPHHHHQSFYGGTVEMDEFEETIASHIETGMEVNDLFGL